MPTRLMKLMEFRRVGQRPLGVGPLIASMPLPAVRQLIQGVSRDNTGVALPSCTCTLFRVDVNGDGVKTYTQVGQTISDPITGAYCFVVGSIANHRVTFDLDGAPIRAGITLNTLVRDAFGS